LSSTRVSRVGIDDLGCGAHSRNRDRFVIAAKNYR
jgi:hypothetical protein